MASAQASSRVHQLLDEHWTTTLDVDPAVWRDAEVVVVSHPEPSHRDHVYLIHREDRCIIVVPQALVGSTTIACASWPSAGVFDRAFVRSLYGDLVVGIHGPFWLGYATAESFRRIDGRGTRLLQGRRDAASLDDLRGQVTDDEWVDAGFAVPARREYGCFAGDQLVCAGTLTSFRGLPASVGVLTSPAQRNRGFGSALVSALTHQALARGPLAQFRMLEESRPALRIARVLGFVEDGRTLEVVLRPAPAGAVSR
ncbi:MAG: GNAT family N-acetyltransferase [Candidatus Dormibacteria bacterium]